MPQQLPTKAQIDTSYTFNLRDIGKFQFVRPELVSRITESRNPPTLQVRWVSISGSPHSKDFMRAIMNLNAFSDTSLLPHRPFYYTPTIDKGFLAFSIIVLKQGTSDTTKVAAYSTFRLALSKPVKTNPAHNCLSRTLHIDLKATLVNPTLRRQLYSISTLAYFMEIVSYIISDIDHENDLSGQVIKLSVNVFRRFEHPHCDFIYEKIEQEITRMASELYNKNRAGISGIEIINDTSRH